MLNFLESRRETSLEVAPTKNQEEVSNPLMAASIAQQKCLERLGFYFGHSGAHAGRALMLEDLATALSHVPLSARRTDYIEAIVGDNLLEKKTFNNRKHAARRMAQMYGLDASVALFRNFRRLWQHDTAARPVLAATLALARDGLFRASSELILNTAPGEQITAEQFRPLLSDFSAGRMSEGTLKHASGNVFGSWHQAGFLARGTGSCTRTRAMVTPTNLAFSLWLAHLENLEGEALFRSYWAKMLDHPFIELIELTKTASRKGLINLLSAGGMIEVRFPGYLLAKEEAAWLASTSS
jgi:hypothetical protein